MKGSLEKRLFLLCFLALAVTVAANTVFSVTSFRRQYREGILRRCNTVATALKTQIEGVINLGLPLAEIKGLDERCQAITASDPEVYFCLIEDAHGKVLYRSTTHPFEPAHTRLVGRLRSGVSDDISILTVSELGRLYDLSLPLVDFNDQLAGRIRIGFQAQILDTLTREHLLWSLLVLGGASASVFLLLVVFIRQALVKPLRTMCATATSIAAGNFAVSQPLMRTRELATLADALEDMATSLAQRDLELRNQYTELETANRELQHSYEQLETMSSELGRSQEMFRSLIDEASDAILVCGEDDRVMIANQSAERFFGVSRREIEQLSLTDFFKAMECQNFPAIDAWFQTIRPGQAGDTELRFVHPLERKVLVGWAIGTAIIDHSGKRFVQVIIRDTTHEEEVRQQLALAATELERLNQLKNSFLGLASHELKTPLTIIMGYSELLQEMGTQLDAGMLEMVGQIVKASERLDEIVNDMVDVSRLDNRTLQMNSQAANINELVRAAVAQIQPALGQRRQKLHVNLADDLPAVHCDRERIIQALANVLGNAVKFTPDYGLIRVGTRSLMRPRPPVRLAAGEAAAGRGLEELHPYVEVTVTDSGIGIAQDEQQAIFEKFYEIGQVEEHSTGKVSFRSRGTGLGLSIVKGIVGMHGGAVWVESPGCDPERFPGSTFYIHLPAIMDHGLLT